MTSKTNAWSTRAWPVRRVQSLLTNPESVPESLFPEGIVLEQANPALASAGDLFPEETRFVANAVDRRRREFAAGRICARRALERLGVERVPILVAGDRAPVWPAGIRGSISHTDDLCGAALTRAETAAGIGFDVESATELAPELWTTVLTIEERAQLAEHPPGERGPQARLAFSLKEAFYKCHRSAGGGWLEFHDVELRLLADDRIELRTRLPLPLTAARMEGRYAVTSRYVFAAFVMYGS